MRKIHFIWVILFICAACSGHEYVEEYENTLTNDSTSICDSDSIGRDTRDSIKINNNDSTSTQNGDTCKINVRTFSVLGNSISTYSGYIPSGYANYYTASRIAVEDTWWMLLSAKEDLELSVNASWAGSSVANKSGKNVNSYFTSDKRIKELASKGVPNLIIVLGGTNDWGDNAGYLGDYPTNGNYDLRTFRGAYSYLVDQLKKRYPTTDIICCSIIPRKQSRTQKNNLGVTQKEIDESIKYICKQYHAHFIDMSICGLEKDVNKYTIDGLHPNKDGMKIIADYLYEQIKGMSFL